jgi:type 1 fimbriae regulatory protein FimB
MNNLSHGTTQVAVDSAERNFLTRKEIESLLKSSKQGRHGVRDYCMFLIGFRHGYRVSELIDIQLNDLDLDAGRLFVRRLKGSLSTTHPLQSDELRALRAWLRERDSTGQFLFVGERGPLTRQAVNYLLNAIARRASIQLKVHPHMLRHSCGFELANRGTDTRLIQDWLGHRNITHTVIYTRTAASRFEQIWR